MLFEVVGLLGFGCDGKAVVVHINLYVVFHESRKLKSSRDQVLLVIFVKVHSERLKVRTCFPLREETIENLPWLEEPHSAIAVSVALLNLIVSAWLASSKRLLKEAVEVVERFVEKDTGHGVGFVDFV